MYNNHDKEIYRSPISEHWAYHGYMTPFAINQDADGGVYIQEQVEQNIQLFYNW